MKFKLPEPGTDHPAFLCSEISKGITKDTTKGITEDTTKGTTQSIVFTAFDVFEGTTKDTTKDTTKGITKDTAKLKINIKISEKRIKSSFFRRVQQKR